ncbi:MAG: hypothetical protein EPO32_14925 [Anaerolineae bacterium]|nr:MAG: hypothetical protein EPO32_14925 [Anaerolineae bacterium]
MDESMMGVGDEEPDTSDPVEGSEDYGDEFSSAISEAFPDQEWSADRLAALKEAIRSCVEKDKGMGTKSKGPGKPGTLALIFGSKAKKE